MRIAIVAIATVAMGIIGSNANAYPVQITGSETVARINTCNDGIPVYWDTITHAIYGDQDGNGILDGEDCNWQ